MGEWFFPTCSEPEKKVFDQTSKHAAWLNRNYLRWIFKKSHFYHLKVKRNACKLVTWPHKRRLFEPEQSAVRRASLFDCSLFDEQFTGQLCSLFILPEHPSLSENKGLFVRLTGDKVKVAPPFIQVWQPDLKLQLKKAHKACSHKAATDKRNRFHTVQQHLR